MTANNVLHVPARFGKTYAAVSALISHPDSQLVVPTGERRRQVLDLIQDRIGDVAFDYFDKSRVMLPEPHRIRASAYSRTIVDDADVVLGILLDLPAHAEFELLTLDQADRS